METGGQQVGCTSGLTFLQRQEGDGRAETPTAQAHQMGLVRLHLQPFPSVDQVQGAFL